MSHFPESRRGCKARVHREHTRDCACRVAASHAPFRLFAVVQTGMACGNCSHRAGVAQLHIGAVSANAVRVLEVLGLSGNCSPVRAFCASCQSVPTTYMVCPLNT